MRVRSGRGRWSGRGLGRRDRLGEYGGGGGEPRRCGQDRMMRGAGFALRLRWDGGEVVRMNCGRVYWLREELRFESESQCRWAKTRGEWLK